MENPTIISVSFDSIEIDQLSVRLTTPTTGAFVVFLGIIRNITLQNEPHQTFYLEYDTYQPMAEQKLIQISQEMRKRWPTIEGIGLIQRIGKLSAGTPTTAILCGTAHRGTAAHEAVSYGIDRIKEIVPVWKKEIGPDNEIWLEGKYHPSPGE